MIYNFLSVYGIYYPSGTIETRAKWRIYDNNFFTLDNLITISNMAIRRDF